jgi:hypothetical protein
VPHPCLASFFGAKVLTRFLAAGADGTDVNSVSRCDACAVLNAALVTRDSRSKSGRLLATGDDFGCVKVCAESSRINPPRITASQLFRFPAVASCQKFRGNIGHSAHVM